MTLNTNPPPAAPVSTNPESAPRRSREQNRAAYREMMLTAAERVFGRVGYHEAKMADIASEAGIAAGTIYNYFESKDEIFQAIVTRSSDRLVAVVREIEPHPDPWERIGLYIRSTFGHLEDQGTLYSIYVQLMGMATYTRKPQSAATEMRFRSFFLGLLERAFAEASARGRVRASLPPAELATALNGLANAYLTNWALSGSTSPLRPQAEIVLDLFYNGCRIPTVS